METWLRKALLSERDGNVSSTMLTSSVMSILRKALLSERDGNNSSVFDQPSHSSEFLGRHYSLKEMETTIWRSQFPWFV